MCVCVCVCVCTCCFRIVLLWCIWNSNHTLGAHACLFISLCLLSQPLFASVGQASARITDPLTWSWFMSLLTRRLVLLCVDAYCFIVWDLPGDVLAAPEPGLCGRIGVIPFSLSLSPVRLEQVGTFSVLAFYIYISHSRELVPVCLRLRQPCAAGKV